MAKNKNRVESVADKWLGVKKEKPKTAKKTEQKPVVQDLPEKPVDPNQTELFDEKKDAPTATVTTKKEPKGEIVKIGIGVQKDVALKIKLLCASKGVKVTKLIVDLINLEFEKMPDKDEKLEMAKTLGI